MPEDDDVVSECRNRGAIGRHRVVGEIPGNDLPEPFSCFRNRLVHLPSQSFLDFLELGPCAVTARLPLDLEITPPRFAANEHKTQELEGLRLGEPALLAVLRRKATELNQAGLVRVKRQRELENSRSLSRIASQKRRASFSCWKPTTRSSAYLTMIMSPVASRRRQRSKT